MRLAQPAGDFTPSRRPSPLARLSRPAGLSTVSPGRRACCCLASYMTPRLRRRLSLSTHQLEETFHPATRRTTPNAPNCPFPHPPMHFPTPCPPSALKVPPPPSPQAPRPPVSRLDEMPAPARCVHRSGTPRCAHRHGEMPVLAPRDAHTGTHGPPAAWPRRSAVSALSSRLGPAAAGALPPCITWLALV